jgi:hypothetical protein
MLQRLVEMMLRMIGGDDGEGSVGKWMYNTVQKVKDDTCSMYGTCHRIPLLSTERQRQQYSLQNFTRKSERLRRHTLQNYSCVPNVYGDLCSTPYSLQNFIYESRTSTKKCTAHNILNKITRTSITSMMTYTPRTTKFYSSRTSLKKCTARTVLTSKLLVRPECL